MKALIRRYALAFITLVFASAMQAGIIVNVTASVGPFDPLGCSLVPANPSPCGTAPTSGFAGQYSDNTLQALQANQTSNPAVPNGDPADYAQTNAFSPYDVIGTEFNSWKGNNSPTGNFANENGNAVYFSLYAYSTAGETFTLDDIEFLTAFSSGPGISYNLGNFEGVFASYLIGKNGATVYDGTQNPGADNTTPLTAVYYQAVGISLFANTPLDATTLASQLASQSLTGSFTVQGVTGTLTLVPEPSTISLFAVSGLALLGAAIRRRRSA